MNGTGVVDPTYRVGPSFLTVDLPNTNALEAGITGGQQTTVRGTDPPGYVNDTLRAYSADWAGLPELPSAGTIGRGIVGTIVALLVIAFGLWTLLK